MSEPGPLLFSYGTLQEEDTQRELFGRRIEGAPDELVGFALVPHRVVERDGREWDHFIVVRTDNEKDRVRGAALAVTPDDLAACDEYEPPPYTRVETTLASGKRAWVYAKGG